MCISGGLPYRAVSAELRKEAAKSWKFQPSEAEITHHVSVVLDFSIACTDVTGK